jgi:ribose/xylose/arabinose/galactoside ABC-type transport system permease subunit
MLALCCMAFGVMAQREASIPLVVLGTLATGALLGAINAVGVGLMRLPPIIMTLATLTIYRGAVLRLGGGDWIQLPEQYLPMGRGLVLGVPIPVWEAFAALAVVAAVMRYTAFGRSLYAVGNNVQASEHLGISMRRSQLAVFTIGGLLVGLAALAYAPRFDVVQTNSGMGLEMLVITAVVVGGTNITGGRGSVLGTLLGVLLLTLISNALNLTQVSDYWEKAFQGVLVLAAVIADHMGRGRRVSGGEG